MARTNTVLRLTLGIIGAAIFFFPIYTVLVGGVKTNGQLLAAPFALPHPFTGEAYSAVLLSGSEFWVFFFNSVLITGLTIFLTLIISMSIALAVARMDFRGRQLIFNFFIMGMLFPITVAILPLYLQLKSFGLTGTRFGVIISQTAFSLPLSVFIFTGFFREIPRDLQDAVSIDGGDIFSFGWNVLIPLSTPVISTVTIITLIQSWNQFLLPLLVLDDASEFTIPLGVMQFQGQYTTGWNRIMAFITIALLPMGLIYIFLQKYIVRGLTAGAVKG